MSRSRALCGLAVFVCLLLPAESASQSNPVVEENRKPGTSEWRLTNPGRRTRAIEGYASLASVNRGGQIRLFVHTPAPTYTMDIFRIGYYGGLGGRRMLPTITRTGTVQPACPMEPDTGLVECNWLNPYVLNIPGTADPTDWMSGFYVVKLTAAVAGITRQQYIVFVVRDDARRSDLLMAQAVNTYHAYNVWGGKSLYGSLEHPTDDSLAAVKVSFNRPYDGDQSNGSSQLFNWEAPFARWLEREGYDVTYATNVDVHRDATLLLSHRAFLSVGHDEYWTWEMRDRVEAARDSGISLGFFSANTSYWQVRYEPSRASNTPNRTLVGYKIYWRQDPLATDALLTNDYLITKRFRDAPVNRSEDTMLGVMFTTAGRPPHFVVEDASHWVFTGTGLVNGQRVTNADGTTFLGYEVDQMAARTPPGTQRMAHSPVNARAARFSDMTVYRAASGATVFATGSIGWSHTVPAIQQITRNVLARLIRNAFVDTVPIRPPLPAGFTAADIGDVGRPGFVALAGNSSFTLNGAGGERDAMYFVYQPLAGDGTITVRLNTLQLMWNNRAGVMIRESLSPSSRIAVVWGRPSESRGALEEGAEFKVKTQTGGSVQTIGMLDQRLPNWLRLTRSGSTFAGFLSADGVTWAPLGTATISMSQSAYVGVAVHSAARGVWATAAFSNVSVTSGGVSTNTLPAGWTASDVGSVGLSGSTAYTGGIFTLRAAGIDVYSTSDAFHYAYRTWTGDGDIVARVTGLTRPADAQFALAGIMFRESLAANARHASAMIGSDGKLKFRRRITVGGSTLSDGPSAGSVSVPRWLKVTRRGDVFRAYHSADGTTWTQAGPSQTLALPATLRVGLWTLRNGGSGRATATFEQVAVTTPP